MRRILMLMLLTMCVSLSSTAQTTSRQKMVHMAAVRMAGQIGVAEKDRDAFVDLYQSFRKESAAVLEIQPEPESDPDAAAEAKILCDFDKSERLLALRRKYYSSFRKVLTPTQIQKMYDSERQAGESRR